VLCYYISAQSITKAYIHYCHNTRMLHWQHAIQYHSSTSSFISSLSSSTTNCMLVLMCKLLLLHRLLLRCTGALLCLSLYYSRTGDVARGELYLVHAHAVCLHLDHFPLHLELCIEHLSCRHLKVLQHIELVSSTY
jgi:hypothetical protein